jgi:uncharacterized cupin superfamily protein
MRVLNIADPGFTYDDDDPPPFHAGMFRLGKQLGATQSGMSVYELPPGQSVCPYHYEYGEEEWLLVLTGRPTLRTPEGERELAPFDAAFFPIGPDGAHQIRNDTGDTVRLAMWSTVITPSATAYPDSGKVGVWTGVEGENLMARRSSHVEYYDGEPVR